MSEPTYEHMKTCAAELTYAARYIHTTALHAGTLGNCTVSMCVHRTAIIRWARHLECIAENPEYSYKDATYKEITTNKGIIV